MRQRRLSTFGKVTDTTPARLEAYGWRCDNPEDWFNSLWRDPRTGKKYAVSEAAAILDDRTNISYTFDKRRR